MNGALSGYRIIDLTSVVLGPYAMQILGDHGADVIKVESPEGDLVRQIGSGRTAGMGPIHLQVNRNKRSIVLDIKKPEGRTALLRLAETADVFVHSMRPQAIQSLGLGDAELRAVNPRIVHAGAYGFRADGPYGAKPAFDDVIQGISGLADIIGRQAGGPRYAPTIMADKTTGLTLAYALLAALLHRERTGHGQRIEVPMFETMVSFLMIEHLWGRTLDPLHGEIGYNRVLSPERKPYPTRDGHICLLPYTDRQWQSFFAIAGRPEIISDPRFCDLNTRARNIAELYAEAAKLTPARDTEEWMALLEPLGVPVTRINRLQDLLLDPHLVAGGMFFETEHPSEGRMLNVAPPVTLAASPAAIRRPAPRLGQHTVEILNEAGYDADDIAAMLAARCAIQAA
ncbi:MAG: CoA transferase [Alphaproteobacteria bacterium]|nr:CoA transferase [Alphaproteobacteria bacterium]